MSAFGLEDSQSAGEGSLVSFIVDKAVQSRQEAKAEKEKQEKILEEGGEVNEKDKKNLFGKALFHNLGGGIFTGTKKFSENFQYKKPPKKEETTGTSPRPKVGDGLRKILVTGFGSLLTDTERIQGGLAATTEILNQQVQMQGMSASSLGSIQSILSDQTENQVSLIESLTGQSAGGGGGGDKKSSAFGMAGAEGAGEGSILKFIEDQVRNALNSVISSLAPGLSGAVLSRIGPRLLFNPWTAVIAGGAVIGVIAAEAIKNKQKASQTPIFNDPEKDKATRQQLQPTLGGTSKVRHPSYLPVGDPRRWPYDNPGKPIPPNIQSQIDSMPKAGPWQKWAAGGVNSMVGEAGKEAVVDLNSADARNQMKNPEGIDPSMKAVGGSLLAVTDAFIKSLGPIGAPVAQTVGGDIQNLSGVFGMSSTLPNLKVGGSLFTDNSSSKRERQGFLKDLIEKSLIYLGAKKKEDKAAKPSAGPGGPGTSGSPEQQAEEDKRAEESMDDLPGGVRQKTVTNKDGTEQKLLESKSKIFGSDLFTRQVDTNGVMPGGMEPRSVAGPSINYRPVEGSNGKRWYDIDGRVYAWEPGTTVRELSKDELATGWNGKPFIRKPDTGHVRVNQEDFTLGGTYQRPPAEGEYSYKWGKIWAKGADGKMGWLTPGSGTGRFGGKAPSLPPSNDIKFESGGGLFNVLGRFLPNTGTVMAPRSSGHRDIRGVRQTQAGFQNRLLGIPIGGTSLPRGRSGQYTEAENRRYYERTGSYFIPTDFGPGYLPGMHGLYRPPAAKPQRTQGAVTAANNTRLTSAISDAQRIGQVTGTTPLMNQTASIATKKQQDYDQLRSAMKDAGMSGADENMNIYGKQYEKGGGQEKQSMFGMAGDTISVSDKLYSVEKQLLELKKYMIINMNKIIESNNKLQRVSSGSVKVSATSDQDQNYAPVLINMQSQSAGLNMPVSVPTPEPETFSSFRRLPEPGGIAALTSYSGTGVL